MVPVYTDAEGNRKMVANGDTEKLCTTRMVSVEVNNALDMTEHFKICGKTGEIDSFCTLTL
jgi:hypothetical protein